MKNLAVKKLLGSGLLLLVMTSPALAQRSGSSNRNAPTITQTIAFGKDTIELSYTSITWGEGQWAAKLADEATKAAARANINANAEKTPLGTLKVAMPITIGTTKVAAGTYKLAFVLDDNYKWQILLTADQTKLNVALDLKNVDEESKRLRVALRAGEKDFTAELAVGFGKSRGTLPIAIERSSG